LDVFEEALEVKIEESIKESIMPILNIFQSSFGSLSFGEGWGEEKHKL
jgi:hypothetical protein